MSPVTVSVRDVDEASPGLPGPLKALNSLCPRRCKDTGLKALLARGLFPGRPKDKTKNESDVRELLDPISTARALGDSVSALADAVDADWFSSHKATTKELDEWARLSRERVNAVHLATDSGFFFEESNDVLKVVADTWSDIEAIPFRLSKTFALDPEVLEDADPKGVLDDAWAKLCASAASRETTSDSTLNRFIKDAVSNGVEAPHLAYFDESARSVASLAPGRKRLARLYHSRKWAKLPSTKLRREMRAIIDRRYEGPKERRTRTFSSYFKFATPSDDDASDGGLPCQ